MLNFILLLLPFSLFFYNINYFITIILLLNIYYLLTSNLTIEDRYQMYINKKNKTKGSLIYVTMQYEDANYFNDIVKTIEDKLIKFNDVYNMNNDFDRICYCNNSYIYYDKELFLKENDYHYKFFIDQKNLKLYSYVKHEYIGGAYLTNLFTCFIHTSQKDNKLLFPESNLINFISVIKLLYNYKNIPKITNYIPLLEDKNNIKRYINQYILPIKNEFSSKTIIIYNIMKQMHKGLNLNRPLVCYLPIAFQHYPGVKNNIGILWITYDPLVDTLETIDKKLYESRYQIMATNFLLLFRNNKIKNSISIRKNVDCVISFLLAKDTEQNSNFISSWTYEYISEYPIYIAISSILKKNEIRITQTITSSTSNFDLSFDPSFKEVSLEEYKIKS